MRVTYVPNPNKADGQLGTGSNLRIIPDNNMRVTYVPNPNAADGRGVLTSAANILEYDGNPNGVIKATGPAILLGSGASVGAVWIKSATDSGNTGWVQVDPFVEVDPVATALESRKKLAALVVSFGEGTGGDQNFQLGQIGTQDDGRVYFSHLLGFTLMDAGSNYVGNGTGTGDTDYYVCPASGWYQVLTKIRITDNTTMSPGNGCGQGAALPGELQIGSHDYPDFLWFGLSPAQRNSSVTLRIVHCTAGNHLSMVTAADENNIWASDGVTSITLISVD